MYALKNFVNFVVLQLNNGVLEHVLYFSAMRNYKF